MSSGGDTGTAQWPTSGICYGGDYNPEQWTPDVWDEDVRLMRAAGVNLVTVGVFSWALLEPSEGRYRFGWLDRVLDLLAGAGIGVDLATATAAPPPWFSHRHPETLPADRDGRRLWPGSRQVYCPSSPIYRERAAALVEQLASRYRDHPALVMWHANNEYGCHNAHCYCDVSAAAFREWLARRYGDLDALNEAWGTAFWSQRYGHWQEILPPRRTLSFPNPTQQLDFARFSSDELLDCFRAERDLLHRLTPGVPVTTNFMVAKHKHSDYWKWAREVDVVANDHYLWGEDPANHEELAFSADLTRSLAAGRPWLLLEHSPSAVNWQRRNTAKSPRQMRRNSLSHVGRGADGVCFFQWRASRAGAEKFHSAMVPHAGTATKIWREVTELGADLAALGEVTGSRVDAHVAIMWDWQSWWASELGAHPTADLRYPDMARQLHRVLLRAGVTCDFIGPDGELSPYALVLVPTLYIADSGTAERVRRYVGEGGHAVVTYFSGIVDASDHVWLGGYPGAFRDVLGVRTEEFFPLAARQRVRLDDGATATVWTEMLNVTTAKPLASYVDGQLPGVPAVTRNAYGQGTAWYVACGLDEGSLDRLMRQVSAEAGATATVPAAGAGVEAVRRRGEGATYLFVINHTDRDVDVPASGHEILGGEQVSGVARVPPGEVAVVRESRAEVA